MRWVVGLGNPGPRYAATRHNIGFLAVEALVRRLGGRAVATRAPAEVWRARCPAEASEEDLLLVRPMNWMNRSGEAVRQLREEAPVPPEGVLVVVDDIYLPFGRQRLRSYGSAGGHNGLSSVEQALGTRSFPRLRVGVGPVPEGVDYREFVLEEFAAPEARALPECIERVVGVVLAVLSSGIDAAQNAVAAANSTEFQRGSDQQ